jgi:hypothetical protein
MCWQENSTMIITIIPLRDKGKEKFSSYIQYWPNSDNSIKYGPFQVTHIDESPNPFYFERTLQVKLISSNFFFVGQKFVRWRAEKNHYAAYLRLGGPEDCFGV